MTVKNVIVGEGVGVEGVELLESTWLSHWEVREEVAVVWGMLRMLEPKISPLFIGGRGRDRRKRRRGWTSSLGFSVCSDPLFRREKATAPLTALSRSSGPGTRKEGKIRC